MAVDRWLHAAECEAEAAASHLTQAVRRLEQELPAHPELPEGVNHVPRRGNAADTASALLGEQFWAAYGRWLDGKELLTRTRSARSRLVALEKEIAGFRERSERLNCS